MPRRLSEYSAADWKRLRPLTHAYKTLIDAALNAAHMRRPPREGDLAGIRRSIAGKRTLITIAFDDPQAIEWQIALIRRRVGHDVHLIADNSANEAASIAIGQIAGREGIGYVRLPKCRERASRGHGLALNWVWRNIVLPAQPSAFGFLDDDLFPMSADDPFESLDQQDFFGLVRHAGDRWFLWAGYCTFDFAAVRDKPLDFRQDWFIGLDTGGANWNALYRHVSLARLRQPSFRQEPFRPGADAATSYFQWCNGWLHEVGSPGRPDLAREKRAVVADLVARELANPAEGE